MQTIQQLIEKVKDCEGDCLSTHGEHKGEVKEVLTSGNNFPPMTFFYCENAIDEDRERGFTVTIKTQHP